MAAPLADAVVIEIPADDVQNIVGPSNSGASATSFDGGRFVEAAVFFLATISAFLIMNQPPWPTPQGLLFHIHSTFLHLAFCTGFSLVLFSLIFPRSPAMARVQRKPTVMGVMFLLVAYVPRVYMELPLFSLVVLGIIFSLIFVYYTISWARDDQALPSHLGSK
ncbi:unnamed protein product [Spirodela intermedia]|uniref:Uncharacterized protein n=1 Tax=Spirodela intermedia TaxID=51605 RepID=A0A7I8LFP7_SPIIN|nr:unnamed protein product [Spirodela intermedia]